MKTVNILTIHKEPNYGAVLQAYALYKKIEELGCYPQIINLSMDYRHFPYTLKYRALLPVYRWIKGYNHCFHIAEDFSKRHCPHQVGDFHTMKELEAYPWNRGDYFLIGSDQVWNPEITQNLRNAFCLSFLGKEYANKFAYAASFGNIRNEEERKERLDMAALAQFKKIAVRERFGVEFLKKNRIEAVEVVDPTLLLEDYSNLLPRKPRTKKEILFLSLSDTETMNSFVKDVSASTGLPVRKFFGYLQPERNKNKKFIPIEEWLYDIASAQLVITDSFHATVFSILFHRPFFVYISIPSKIHRISNLLSHIGIRERIVNNVKETQEVPPIDYEQVEKLLSDYRHKSINYLKSFFE